jgi:hypothetical protein
MTLLQYFLIRQSASEGTRECKQLIHKGAGHTLVPRIVGMESIFDWIGKILLMFIDERVKT